MAKNMRRFLAIALALTLCFMLMAPTASAWGWNPPGYGDNDSYEWYEVYVQGNLAASGQGRKGDVYFLGTHYEADVDFSGNTLTWHINPIGGSSGNFSGTVNLSDYIEIPEGYIVQDYDIEELSIDGVNDPVHNMYDNAVIRITIKSLYNEDTDDTIIIPDPDPVDPEPTEPVDYAPVLSITKTADKAVYEIGETVTWTITVTNTGSDTAYDVVITDPLTGDTWEIDYLAAGESYTVTVTATALEAGSLANTAIVNWTDNDEIPDEDETDEPKTGSDTETVTIEEPEVTEPEPTESEPTEPAPSETDPVESDPTEPDPQPDKPNDNYGIDPYADIPDEDVPLADVPVTGDISLLWAALSIFSGAALVAVNTKRKED